MPDNSGGDAKLLAGGQSLIPLLKLRFANPEHLVDLNFIVGTSLSKKNSNSLHFGSMTRHPEIEHRFSQKQFRAARTALPASLIAGAQPRHDRRINRRADPSGDWASAVV